MRRERLSPYHRPNLSIVVPSRKKKIPILNLNLSLKLQRSPRQQRNLKLPRSPRLQRNLKLPKSPRLPRNLNNSSLSLLTRNLNLPRSPRLQRNLNKPRFSSRTRYLNLQSHVSDWLIAVVRESPPTHALIEKRRATMAAMRSATKGSRVMACSAPQCARRNSRTSPTTA